MYYILKVNGELMDGEATSTRDPKSEAEFIISMWEAEIRESEDFKELVEDFIRDDGSLRIEAEERALDWLESDIETALAHDDEEFEFMGIAFEFLTDWEYIDIYGED